MYYFYDLCQFFFFNDTATTEIYTLSLHDALPIYRLVMGVEQNQKRFVADRLADAVHIVERAAVQFETDTAHPARVPFFGCHLAAVRAQPGDVVLLMSVHLPLRGARVDAAILEKFAAVQVRMLPAQFHQPARER